MHPKLQTRRRALIHASLAFNRADEAWRQGLERAAAFMPEIQSHGRWMIGNPGSRMRALYDTRSQALNRLAVARLKLQVARERLLRQQAPAPRARVLLLTRS